MAKVINQQITSTQQLIEQDNKVLQEAKVVIERVKHGWYSQYIESNTHNQDLNMFKNHVNDMIRATRDHFMNMNDILDQYSK